MNDLREWPQDGQHDHTIRDEALHAHLWREAKEGDPDACRMLANHSIAIDVMLELLYVLKRYMEAR